MAHWFLLDTATGTSDVINLKTDINGNLALGDLANVETVNLSAVDKFVDVTGGTDAFGVAIADGIDDTNSVSQSHLILMRQLPSISPVMQI